MNQRRSKEKQRAGKMGGVSCRSSQSYGVAALAVIVCLIVVVAIGGALLSDLKASWEDYREARLALQADWLVASAVDRLKNQLAKNLDYPGETWQIDAGKLDGRNSGEIQIIVIRSNEADQRVTAKIVLHLRSKGHTRWTVTRFIPVEMVGAAEGTQTTPLPSATS